MLWYGNVHTSLPPTIGGGGGMELKTYGMVVVMHLDAMIVDYYAPAVIGGGIKR